MQQKKRLESRFNTKEDTIRKIGIKVTTKGVTAGKEKHLAMRGRFPVDKIIITYLKIFVNSFFEIFEIFFKKNFF